MDNKKAVIWCGIIAILFALGFFLWNAPSDAEPDHEDEEHTEIITLTPEQIESAGIVIREAGPGTLQTEVQSPGKVTVNENKMVHIVPKASGIVLRTHKNIGESVKAGELLAQLQSKELAEAKSAYLAALKRQQLTSSILDTEQKTLRQKSFRSAGLSLCKRGLGAVSN